MSVLKRLKVNKYRSVEPTEVTFSDTINVILGKNASGKTTLLEFISCCLGGQGMDDSMKYEEIDVEYEINMGATMTVQHKSVIKKRPDTPIDTLLKDVDKSKNVNNNFSVHVIININTLDNKLYYMEYDSDKSSLSMRFPSGSDVKIIHQNFQIFFPLHQTIMTQCFSMMKRGEDQNNFGKAIAEIFKIDRPYRYDESLECFRTITEDNFSPLGRNRNMELEVEIRADGKQQRITYDNIPQELVSSLHLPNKRIFDRINKNSIEISDLIFLTKICSVLEFEHGIISFPIIKMEHRAPQNEKKDSESQTIKFGKPSFYFERNGVRIHHSELSYGQRRIVALYYYLACNSNYLIADELVNGMHHSWIQHCRDELVTRQSFVTSQNPLLLDQLSFTSAAEAHQKLIVCKQEWPSKGRSQFFWENMSMDDANDFFEAYNAGIEHVGEILQSKKLW